MQTATKGCTPNLEHILGELCLLDRLLSIRLAYAKRRRNGLKNGGLHGLVIHDEEVEALLYKPPAAEDWGETSSQAQMEDVSLRQIELEEATVKDRSDLRLKGLQNKFGVDSWEAQVLLLCLAPTVDKKYETIYAFLQDDIGKKRPTVGLALDILTSTFQQKVERRSAFYPTAPLFRHGFLSLQEDPYSKGSGLLDHFLSLDPRIAEYMLGSDEIDPSVSEAVSLLNVPVSWDEVVLSTDLKSVILELTTNIKRHLDRGNPVRLQLVGAPATGKTLISQAIANSLGKSLLRVDLAKLVALDPIPSLVVDRVVREASLQNAVLCWDKWHTVIGAESSSAYAKNVVESCLSRVEGLTLLEGAAPWHATEPEGRCISYSVELHQPDFSSRKMLWKRELTRSFSNGFSALSDAELDKLTSAFRLTGGQIQRSVTTAHDNARMNPSLHANAYENLSAAARWHSSQGLSELAQKIETNYIWDDLVLPLDQKTQLKEICSYFQNIAKVYEHWGFERKTSLGKGLSILFAGPSGTGKTMSAQIIARQLGLNLYRIDLSTLVSKYIGETEKNLARIFNEAERSNAVLFFDEADALFGKRSEVRDSHDRYANIEISYLLQRMEEFQGVVILASNLRNNLDDAFTRRLHFSVEFPFPDETQRRRIWERVFPRSAPLGEDVDLGAMASQFKISGGNIKNIAVTSAFLAAQEGEVITMPHLIWATRREYQKMSKLVVESEFGCFFPMTQRSTWEQAVGQSN